jgi:hypothetical protein
MGWYSESTLKRLFGLSMNVCAFRVEGEPACEERLIDADWRSVKARICHIRARSEKGPRYDADMTEEDRYDFDNLILLCPNHHVKIDDLEPDRFTVQVLTKMKWDAIRGAGAGNAWERDNDALIDRAVDRLIAVMERENSLGPLQPVSMRSPTSLHLEFGEPMLNVTGKASVDFGALVVNAEGTVVEGSADASEESVVSDAASAGGPGASLEHEVIRGAQDEIFKGDSTTR